MNTGDKQFGTDGVWTPPSKTMERNVVGEWVESIPLPFYRTLYGCPACSRSFWTMRGYRGHFALVHILKMRAN